MSQNIVIVDYDAGNIKSVEKAVQFLGFDCNITRDLEQIKKADKIIIPGVGSFGDAMEKMRQYNLVDVLRDIAAKGNVPMLGICLGLQILFSDSEETTGVEGLSLLPGHIVKFPDTPGFKIPHMGWNSIKINSNSKLFKGIEEDSYVYFVHSYYLKASREEDVAATSDYIHPFHAAVESGNIFATQFHPEKSGEVGLKILRNFIEL
ncbi:MAG: imidazole glycerol phosphate synthase subunit HisH [Eubacterium sp.]|nr:imidazole glycerol phosphate synthase subunit HisH [Eubacterium sp.]